MKLELVLLQCKFPHSPDAVYRFLISLIFGFLASVPQLAFRPFLVGPLIAQFYLVSALSYLSGFKAPRFLRLFYLTFLVCLFLSLAWLNEARTGFITVQVSTQSRRAVAFPYLTYFGFLASVPRLALAPSWLAHRLPSFTWSQRCPTCRVSKYLGFFDFLTSLS